MSGLEQEFPEVVVASNLDAKIPANADKCKQLGFASHGLVIEAAEGTALWSQPDHSVKMEDVRVKLRELLAR